MSRQEEPAGEKITTWVMPIKKCLEVGEVSYGEVEATRIRRVTPNYLIIDGMLYKKGYSTTYLRCVINPDSDHILTELHEGYATFHEGARSMVRKALR